MLRPKRPAQNKKAQPRLRRNRASTSNQTQTNYRPDTTISKTSRTFSTSALGVNGFCKNATPLSNVPFSAITLYVYPDM